MNYEVWLHARDPETGEMVATLRVFAHPERPAAENALENAHALFVEGNAARVVLPHGSVVSAHLLQNAGREILGYTTGLGPHTPANIVQYPTPAGGVVP